MYQHYLRWFALVVCLLTPAVASAQKLVTAGGPGTSPAVRVFDASGTDQTFLAYPAGFPGGVRVALGDVTGDGVLDIVTGAGPGGGPHVRVWNGTDLTEVGGFFAYDPAFPGGVFVAAGDVNGDGKADIITGAGAGGGPHVRIWDGATFTEIGGFFAYDPAFPGGVNVAAGDVNGDGLADIITGAGPSGGPHVRVWNGATLTELGGFFAYDPAFPGGVNVAAGDVNGDGLADIITGAGPGGGPHVRVWNGATFAELGGFFAYDPAFPGGVVVGTVDLDRDGRNELITGPALGSPLIRLWTGTTFALFGEYFAYDPALGGNGVFVGSAAANPSTDDAPRVASTVPANNATEVPIDADLTVTFSEPVTAGVGAFVLECAGGTPIFLTNSGLPATTFTFNPSSPLPLSTACTLRIVRSQIADEDTDDPPDAMTADVIVSFTTSACTLITVAPTTVPFGTLNLPYAPITFFPTGGTPPFTWSITSGTLPAGMTLSASGVLGGTPTQAGAFPLTITATASGGCTGSVSLTLNIASGPNVAPSFTVGPNQTVLEDAGAQSVANWATAISPGLIPGEAGQVVTFTITGNTNPALFGTAPAVSPTGALTYTPAANANGTATITLVLQDNGGTALGGVDTSAPQTFTITVTAVNDAPSFAVGPDQTVLENAGPQTVAGWAVAISPGPTDEAGQTVTFSVTGNTNAALFSAGPAVSPTGTLTYTPAPSANGTATITLALQDNGGTATGGVDTSPGLPFTITVTAVNSAPSFTIGANQTVLEDAGPQAIANWATNISPGGPDEAGQTLQFNVTGNTNPALFNAGPVVSSTGTLIYALALNSSGTATITLTLSDNGGTANGGVDTSAPQSFTITISNINDAPSFTAGANPMSGEDAGPQTIANWATAISPGPPNEAGQSVSFIVTNNTNAALFSAAPAVSPTGALTYSSAPNAFGTATITLVLQDNGGTAGGGIDTSAPQIFTITVTPVNDPPMLTTPVIAYATVGNTQLHVAGSTLAGVASIADASSALTKSVPADIDGPSAPTVVPFTGATPNGTVALNADGSFTYVPALGFTGTDTFTYQVTDSVTPVTGIINITVSSLVWYVNNQTGVNNPAGGGGRSTDAFETLTAAETASAANDIIFVFNGDSQTTPLGGITLKTGQKLHGEGIGLTVVGFGTFVPAGTQPRLTSAGNTIAVLANTANGDRTGVEIRGLSLVSTGGNAIDVTSANTQALGVRISENTITGSGAAFEGIDINQGSTGTATLDVRSNTIAASGTGIDVNRTAGTVTITAFNDNSVSGNTTGSGIMVTGPSVTFDATPGGALNPVSGGTTVIGAPGNGVSGAGLVLTNVTGALDFADLDIFADNGAALAVIGTGQFTGAAGTRITVAPSAGVLTAIGGSAAALANVTADLQLGGLTSTNSAADGVALNSVSGTFSAPTGATITNAAGVDFNVAGGNATITYNGTITDDVGQLVVVTGTTGGTKSFTGAITDGNDGDGSGIALSSNTGATITFSGGLVLSTGANAALTATGGGTINLCDENPCNPAATGLLVNTLTTTTGQALNITGTTIGANNLEFRSISVNGAAAAVNLSNTGTIGGLKVKGTGSAGSGGTIQNITNRGISLVDTAGVDLNWINFTNATTTNGADPTNSASGCGDLQTGGNLACNAPIHLVNVTPIGAAVGANLNRLNITNSAQVGINLNNVMDVTISNVTLAGIGNQTREYGIKGRNVQGSVILSALSITGSFGDNFRVENNTGTANVTVTGGTFNNSTEGNGFLLTAQGLSQTNLNMSTTTITGNFATGLFTGVNDPSSSATAGVIVTGGTYSNNNAGVQIIQSGAADVTFSVVGAGVSSNPAAGIALDMSDQSTAAGSLIGTLSGNTVTQPASGAGNGIFLSARGAGTTTIRVANNTVQNRTQYGIHLHKKEGLNGTLNATVTGNTVTTFDTAADTFFPIDGIRVEAAAAPTDTGTVCANISGNTATGAGSIPAESPGDDIRLRARFAHTFQLPGLVGTNGVAATNLLNTNNPASGSIIATTTTSFTTVGSCPVPPP